FGTPTVFVSMLISEYQDEIARREMLEDIVQGDSECAIERWSRLRCTSFWDGHFILVGACLANVQGIGPHFHGLLLSTVRFEPTLQQGVSRYPRSRSLRVEQVTSPVSIVQKPSW